MQLSFPETNIKQNLKLQKKGEYILHLSKNQMDILIKLHKLQIIY